MIAAILIIAFIGAIILFGEHEHEKTRRVDELKARTEAAAAAIDKEHKDARRAMNEAELSERPDDAFDEAARPRRI